MARVREQLSSAQLLKQIDRRLHYAKRFGVPAIDGGTLWLLAAAADRLEEQLQNEVKEMGT